MRSLSAPALQASVPDLEFAHTVLLVGTEPVDDAPILDLRIRKGVRRNGVKLAIASARPSTLDRNAQQVTLRHAPGGEAGLLTELACVLDGADTEGDELRGLAGLLRDGGEDVVIVWSERIGAEAAAALARIAESLELAGRSGAGLLEIPTGANGRGLREAGAIPDAGPGYAALAGETGNDAAGIARAAADGKLTALYLLQTDPVRDQPDRALWERALHSAALVVAHASVLTEGLREHATVIFPAESHAEKEGTVVHPDGRLQRLRIAIAHPGEVRAGWAVLAELAAAPAATSRSPAAAPPSRSWWQPCPSTPGSPSRSWAVTVSAGPRPTPPVPSQPATPSHHPRRSIPTRVPPRRPMATGSRLPPARHPASPIRAARELSSCAWAPTARSGPRPRSRSRRR